MSHLYEPDADAALDEGSEPPNSCRHCGVRLEEDEGSICPRCEDERDAAQLDDVIDQEREEQWYERRGRLK